MDFAEQAIEQGCRELIANGYYADAVAAMTRKVAANPQSVASHACLAAAEGARSHLSEAREGARHALTMDPESELAHRVLASILLKLGDKQGAHREAVRAIELAPASSRGYGVLAAILLSRGDPAGALAAADEAVRLAPGSPEAHATVALVKLRSEDWRGSEAAAREALRRDPENAPALILLTIALSCERRTAQAADAFEQAVRINPHHPVCLRIGASLSRATVRQIGASTQALIAEDRRTRRYRPWQWNWRRRRPRWIPPSVPSLSAPKALVSSLAVTALLVLLALSVGGLFWIVPVAGCVAVFNDLRRTRMWWRVRHPARDSWTPSRAGGP